MKHKKLNFIEKMDELIIGQGFVVFLTLAVVSALSAFALSVLSLGQFDGNLDLDLARWLISLTFYFLLVDLLSGIVLNE